MLISFSKFLAFYITFLLIGTIERINSTFLHKEIKVTKIIYRRWTFLVPFYTYLLILFFSIGEYFLRVKLVNLTISTIGVIIFIMSALLRRKSIADLGKNWSVYIEIKENHELITNGIYKALKHPYCLAVFFELIGVCLIANTFYSLLLVFLIQAPLLLIRITLEERVLIEHFGEVYRKYSSGKFL